MSLSEKDDFLERNSNDAEASIEPEKSHDDKPEGKPEGDLETRFECSPEPEERKRIKPSIFVRNLPYTLKENELIAAMEKVGPVKRAFIVLDKITRESRGFGLVTFSFPDDAKRAMQQIKFIGGRQVSLHEAEDKQRRSSKDDNVKGGKKHKLEKSEEKDTQFRKRAKYEDFSSRLILLTGLRPGITELEIREAMVEYGNISLVIYPHPESAPGRIVALVVFTSPASAKAFAYRNKRPFKIGKHPVGCRHVEESNKSGRLVIHNLSYEADEEELEALFGKYGELTEIKIIKKPDGRSRGFAFVNFKDLIDAAKARRHWNKKEIRDRVVAVDWAVPKNRWEKLKKFITEARKSQERERLKKAMKSKKEGAGPQESNETRLSAKKDDQKEGEQSKGEKIESEAEDKVEKAEKNKSRETKSKKSEEGMDTSDEESESESQSEQETESSTLALEKATKLDERIEKVIREEEDFLGSSDSETETEEGIVKTKEKRYAEPDAQTTIFCTNLPYEATKKDLYAVFRKYGYIMYATVVMDKEQDRSKGKAFVQFATREAARKAIEEGKPDDALRTRINQRTRQQQTRLISEGSGIEILGRRIFVFMAQPKGNVINMREKNDQDKRNFNLLACGLEITPGLSKNEITKREGMLDEKRRRLRNTSLYISRCRLALRNLPRTLNDKELKMHFSSQAGALRRKNKNEGYKHKAAKIFQAKVVRSKKEDVMGNSPSLRYGFVHFREHADAMACLKYYNSNPFEGSHRIRVEFAVENALIVNARTERMKRDRRLAKLVKAKARQNREGDKERRSDDRFRSEHSKSKKRSRLPDRGKKRRKRGHRSLILRSKRTRRR